MPNRSELSNARTGRDVVRDVISDLDAWKLTPFEEVRYLMRISAYHKRLLESAEQAERTPADHERSADHFGRWLGITSYLLWLTRPLVESCPPRASVHREEVGP